ncbi:MAG: ABC transporter ATP-binding protein [Clostridia bacterium]|nr:ABC transporter ATP-binding protein [Clostridia bacterium]
MKKILVYLKPYGGRMTVSFLVKILATMSELALPYILSYIIDKIIRPLEGQTDVDTAAVIKRIVIWSLFMMLCAAVAVVGNITANRMAAKVSKTVAGEIRSDLFKRTMALSPAQTDAYTVASLESRLTTDTYNIHHFMNVVQRMGVRAPIMLIGGLIITATLDPVLTGVMACVLPFIFIAVYGISVKGLPLFRETQKAVDGMVKVVREDAQGIRVIKALSRKKYESERYDTANKGLAAKEKKANLTMAAANPVMNFFMNLGLTAVVFAGAVRVNSDLTEPGRIVAFIQYFTLISMAMLAISRLFVIFSKASASAGRVAEVLDTPADLEVKKETDYPAQIAKPFICFDKVSFAYNNTKNVLHDISFTLEKGQSLGIIGATGSGKTTILALLMRLYDVTEGNVYIDGKDVRTIPKEKLHTMFGAAMQNDFIFAGKINENIKFFRDISDEDMVSSAKTAQADGFISGFEEGYERELTSKGNNLSGGQRQRTFISRAVAGKPEILVLDDSSSALDYRTDSALRKALKTDTAGSTTIVVAQRVSSVMSCDKIIVLSEGRISAAGTHEHLLEVSEEYREISNSQMGGAVLD